MPAMLSGPATSRPLTTTVPAVGGHSPVTTFISVDLPQPDGKAAQGIGLVLGNCGERGDPVDHLAQCLTRGIVEIGVEAERDQMRGALRTRQPPVQILSHAELECALERRFDRAAVHLSV